MQGKKKIVIGALCALVMIMAVGYALLSQQLQITGQANITSNWQVEITDIKEVENIGSGRTISTNYTATTATFNNEVIHTGDKITYEITVTNKGTLDAVLENYTIDNGDNDAIIVTTDKGKEFYKGLKLTKNGGTNTITLSVQYDPETTIQPANSSNSISVTLNYQQDLGQVSREYKKYTIGDKITFAGSEWYTIKNSTEAEDYVTLMKEAVLTAAEIGSNYAYGYFCPDNYSLDYHSSFCSEVGQTGTFDSMAYYWNDSCNSSQGYHLINTYGTNIYETADTSKCSGHNDYAGSKLKEFLEGTYINTLGADNLKEVDGYKIRLITKDELFNNLSFAHQQVITWYEDRKTDNTPTWVYENFGEKDGLYGYWTMTPNSNNSSIVWSVNSGGQISSTAVSNASGVRPVINLLKSSIE